MCASNHLKIHEMTTDGALLIKRNKQKYISSLRFQHFSFIHYKTSMPKHIKYIDDFESIVHRLDLIDFCRTLYSTMGEYTFFSSTYLTSRQIIFWAMKQISINLNWLKSYRMYYVTTLELNRTVAGKYSNFEN